MASGRWHVLVDHDAVTIRVDEHDVGRFCTCRIGLGDQVDPAGEESLLDLADVGELLERPHLLVDAGIERQDRLVEHPLEQADDGLAVAQDQPVLVGVAAYGAEAECFVERRRRREIGDWQADGERSQAHRSAPSVAVVARERPRALALDREGEVEEQFLAEVRPDDLETDRESRRGTRLGSRWPGCRAGSPGTSDVR